MIDYLLKFPSKQEAEQFGVANGFASVAEDGTIKSNVASHEHALCVIGEHNGDGQWWVLFRDIIGIPVPDEANQFIHWDSSSGFPRPDDELTPQTFWA